MTKRRDVLKKISKAAELAGITWEQVPGTGRGRHDKFTLGGQRIAVPRHVEINNMTEQSIYKMCESELGEDWWR